MGPEHSAGARCRGRNDLPSRPPTHNPPPVPRTAPFLVIPLLLVGCGDDRELREWTPEDHVHPPQAQVDPSRVPQDQPQGSSEERAAAALWIVTCASCHGREGRGDGEAKPPGVQMTDFTDPAWQASTSDEELAQVIAEGRDLMPRFDDRINPRGIAALVGHIRRLNPEQPPQPEGGTEAAEEAPAPAQGAEDAEGAEPSEDAAPAQGAAPAPGPARAPDPARAPAAPPAAGE